MIGEINVYGHIWKVPRTTVRGWILLQLLFVRSADYWTHASTVGIWPAESHTAIRCWHMAQGKGCAGEELWGTDANSSFSCRKSCIYMNVTLFCCVKAEMNDCQISIKWGFIDWVGNYEELARGWLYSLLLQALNLGFALIMEKGTKKIHILISVTLVQTWDDFVTNKTVWPGNVPEVLVKT